MKRVAIYARTSTIDKQSPEMQVQELTEYAKLRGWEITAIYEDRGFTGGNNNRPKLRELMGDARFRKLDLILCWKLDRFARSLKDLIGMLQELTELGVDFVSLKDQIDLTTAAGRLMVHIIGAFAEFERALIRERTVAGLDHARRKGKRLGRPRSRDDASIVRLRGAGLSYTAIEKQLGCDRSAIYRALKAIAKTQSRDAFQVAEKTRHENPGEPISNSFVNAIAGSP